MRQDAVEVSCGFLLSSYSDERSPATQISKREIDDREGGKVSYSPTILIFSWERVE